MNIKCLIFDLLLEILCSPEPVSSDCHSDSATVLTVQNPVPIHSQGYRIPSAKTEIHSKQ